MTTREPRFARIAAMIGDPTRARMLAALLDGTHRPAGEVAAAAGITAPTASAHLAKLVDAGLLSVRTQGRHRYYGLADAEIAHALEALSVVAERDPAARAIRSVEEPMKKARSCYGHLAGELGVALLHALLARGWLHPQAEGYALAPEGEAWLRGLGIDPHEARRRARRWAYPCLDWSERRDHLAGAMAAALLDRMVDLDWLRRRADSRSLIVTPAGRAALKRELDIAA